MTGEMGGTVGRLVRVAFAPVVGVDADVGFAVVLRALLRIEGLRVRERIARWVAGEAVTRTWPASHGEKGKKRLEKSMMWGRAGRLTSWTAWSRREKSGWAQLLALHLERGGGGRWRAS